MIDLMPVGNPPDELLKVWLQDLQINDRAKSTIRRYKSAIESFLVWYEQEEQRPFTRELLTHLGRIPKLSH